MARPTYASRVPKGTDIEVARVGSRLLGLPLLPQGELVAGLLEARRGDGARFPEAVVQMPRRSTKTTSIWATVLGRAQTRPGYRCVVTAQSGTTASRILLDHASLMLAAGTAVESRERGRDDAAGKVVVYRNGGREHLDFGNGARVWVVPPDAGAVRSAAADDIVIDEAGEHDPVKGRDFLDAVQPLMDTRGPLAQLIIAGTPGKVRAGFFWDALEQGRAGTDRELGILDYSIRDDEDAEDRKVWRRVHPGPASKLTPMSVLERRWAKLGPVAFSREYLCRWPFDGSTSAIDQAAWAKNVVPDRVVPDRFGLAFDCAPDGSAAALCAAWRDDDGIAYLSVLDYRFGVSWLSGVAHAVARRYRVPVRYDAIGTNHGPAQEIARLRGANVIAGTSKDAQAAAQLLVSTLTDGRLRHFGQASLNTAAQVATWREREGGRYFGRRHGDISTLVAGALALYQFDAQPVRRAPVIVSSGGGA